MCLLFCIEIVADSAVHYDLADSARRIGDTRMD